jgi:hypothetical protein
MTSLIILDEEMPDERWGGYTCQYHVNPVRMTCSIPVQYKHTDGNGILDPVARISVM